MSIELNSKEINNTIFLNLIKMLNRRELIDDIDKSYEDIINDINNKNVIEIKLNNNTVYYVYIVNVKITTISQNSAIDEFLSSNTDIHKIIIFKDPSKKVLKQILTEYKNTEFFFEHDLLEDIPSKIFIPEHQLLKEDQKAELLTKYALNELSMILTTDIMSRHYDAKVGDVFRIIRSCSSGNSIFYRCVHHGNLDIFF
jgi:DNA-directed RNA polymerase subunit H (RpoH/RPB5)